MKLKLLFLLLIGYNLSIQAMKRPMENLAHAITFEPESQKIDSTGIDLSRSHYSLSDILINYAMHNPGRKKVTISDEYYDALNIILELLKNYDNQVYISNFLVQQNLKQLLILVAKADYLQAQDIRKTIISYIATEPMLQLFIQKIIHDSDFKKDSKQLLSNQLNKELAKTINKDFLIGNTPVEATALKQKPLAKLLLPAKDKFLIINNFDLAIYNKEPRKKLADLKGHTDKIMSAEWNSQATQLITASLDKTARIWDATTGNQLLLLQHAMPVLWANWSPLKDKILTLAGNQAFVWDASTGDLIVFYNKHTTPIIFAQWSPDGKRILTITREQRLHIWDANSCELLLVLEPVRWATWSDDATEVTAYYNEKYIQISLIPRNLTFEQVLLLKYIFQQLPPKSKVELEGFPLKAYQAGLADFLRNHVPQFIPATSNLVEIYYTLPATIKTALDKFITLKIQENISLEGFKQSDYESGLISILEDIDPALIPTTSNLLEYYYNLSDKEKAALAPFLVIKACDVVDLF